MFGAPRIMTSDQPNPPVAALRRPHIIDVHRPASAHAISTSPSPAGSLQPDMLLAFKIECARLVVAEVGAEPRVDPRCHMEPGQLTTPAVSP
jgi:hypothetical protein